MGKDRISFPKGRGHLIKKRSGGKDCLQLVQFSRATSYSTIGYRQLLSTLRFWRLGLLMGLLLSTGVLLRHQPPGVCSLSTRLKKKCPFVSSCRAPCLLASHMIKGGASKCWTSWEAQLAATSPTKLREHTRHDSQQASLGDGGSVGRFHRGPLMKKNFLVIVGCCARGTKYVGRFVAQRS